MRRFDIALRHALLFSVLGVSMPASILAADVSSGASLPPISFAPEVSDDDCRKRLEAELAPSAAPYEEYYRCKTDFAQLEHRFPLSQADLMKITPGNLMAKETTQEHVDQIYARLRAGSIPDGLYQVHVFRSVGGAPFESFAKLAGVKGQGLALLLSKSTLICVMPEVWEGKVFDRNNKIVRTKIGDFKTLPEKIKQHAQKVCPADQELLKNFQALLAQLKHVFPEIEKIEVVMASDPKALFLPAKVYCGQSLLDGRRESIIIDYAFSQERPEIDKLMGPQRLNVRDEIRMVRPGFYLGRVYMGRIFVLNMILYNEDLAKQNLPSTTQDCWVGTQQVAVGPK